MSRGSTCPTSWISSVFVHLDAADQYRDSYGVGGQLTASDPLVNTRGTDWWLPSNSPGWSYKAERVCVQEQHTLRMTTDKRRR